MIECRVWIEQIDETGIDHISNSITIIQAHNIHTLNNETQITNRFDWKKKKKKIWHLFYVEYYSLGLVLLVKLLISNAIEKWREKKIVSKTIAYEIGEKLNEELASIPFQHSILNRICLVVVVAVVFRIFIPIGFVVLHCSIIQQQHTKKKCVSSPNFHRNSMLQSCCFRFPISFDVEI